MRVIVPAFAALVALAAPVTLDAQQSAPSSPGEQTFRELVRVMNAADRVALRRFVDERFVSTGQGAIPAEQRVERLGNLRAALGELAVRSVDAANPREVAGLVQSTRTEQWRRMIVY